jgi:hypothetical protein
MDRIFIGAAERSRRRSGVKALDTDRAQMPEAGEGFEFYFVPRRVQRASVWSEKINRNYGNYSR